MSHTLTAGLKQALLSLGFLDEKNYKHTMVGRKLYIIMRLSAHAGGVCNNSWRR